MKKIIFIILLISFLACGKEDQDVEFEKILSTYKEILVAREEHQDTSIANKKVLEILSKDGYTEPSFRAELNVIINKDKGKFIMLLESLRTSLSNDYKLEKTRYDSLEAKNKHRNIKDSLGLYK